MDLQGNNSNVWREKQVIQFVQRMFLEFARHTEIPPLSRQKMTINILKAIQGKVTPAFESQKQFSYFSSLSSDMLKGSSNGQKKVMAKVLAQEIAFSNQHMLIQQSSFQNIKPIIDVLKHQNISERVASSLFPGNVSSIDEQTQKQLKSDSQNSEKHILRKIRRSCVTKTAIRRTKRPDSKAIGKLNQRIADCSLFNLSSEKRCQRRFSYSVDNDKSSFQGQYVPKNKKMISKHQKAKERGRKPMDPLMQKNLVMWIKQQNSTYINLPQRKIREKAKQLSSKPNFRASKGWLQKFLNRNRQLIYSLNESNYQIVTRKMAHQDGITVKKQDF